MTTTENKTWRTDSLSTNSSAELSTMWLQSVTISATIALVLGLFYLYGQPTKLPKLPCVNPAGFFDLFSTRAKLRFLMGGREIVLNGFREHPGGPGFRMVADGRELVMLSPKYASELKSDHRVDFVLLFLQDFHEGIPGFEFTDQGARDAKILRAITKNQLTHQLGKTSGPIEAECVSAATRIFGDSEDYQEIELRSSVLELIARVSSRIFLGGESSLYQDEEWLKVTKTYAGTVMKAAVLLRLVPRPLRPFLHWFFPAVKHARRIMAPFLESRRRAKLASPDKKFTDTVEWAEQTANGVDYDPVAVQLLFSMAAMHTTTDLLTQVVLDIAMHCEVLEPLRIEIETVLREEGGFTKASFHKMRLLDSVLKECQRMKPAAIAGLRGVLNADITLSDGLFLPRRTAVAVSSHLHWDDDTYSDAAVWNGWRFYELRKEAGKEHRSQLVSTSPEHMGFGLGIHACPGRFFAAHLVKMALCHLLLNYDWKLADECVPKTRNFMWSMVADPQARVMIRKRNSNAQV